MPTLHVWRSDDDLLMISIVPATEQDVPAILSLIKALAEYERLSHAVVATEADLHRGLFGPEPFAEVILANDGEATVGFALFFHTYSTFVGRPGLYLEDLFVLPDRRGQGYGKALLAALARIAVDRGCGRFEWSVSTGTKRQSVSIGAWVRRSWTSGASAASRERRLPGLRTPDAAVSGRRRAEF